MKIKNEKARVTDQKKKHNNERLMTSWCKLPTDVIPPNFGSKSRKKLK